MSKTALGRVLAVAGIGYEHRRELGDPKVNRAGFGGAAVELGEARAGYQALLSAPEANDAIDAVVRMGREERVALLGFEADEGRCHREVLLDGARRWLTDLVVRGRLAR